MMMGLNDVDEKSPILDDKCITFSLGTIQAHNPHRDMIQNVEYNKRERKYVSIRYERPSRLIETTSE